jgi:uncharacterized membrane-anchored protein
MTGPTPPRDEKPPAAVTPEVETPKETRSPKPDPHRERRLILPILLLMAIVGVVLLLISLAVIPPVVGWIGSLLLGLAIGLTFHREIIWVIRRLGDYYQREGWMKLAIAIISLVGLFILVPILVIFTAIGVMIRALSKSRRYR